MQAVEYRRRESVLSKGADVWRAGDDRLEQFSPDGALKQTIPYAAVQKVRLAFAPGRLQTKRFLMELSGQRSQVTLTNMHFKSVGDFEDRTETFFPLVRAVTQGVRQANPSATFRAGEKPSYYAFLLSFVIASFSLLAVVVFSLPLVPGNFGLSVLVKLGIILVSLPLLFNWVLHARPRKFDPDTGLEAVLDAR